MREIPPPVFSRRSFIFFIILAPACLLTVAAIVLTLQYRQFRSMVAPDSAVPPMVSTPESFQGSATILQALASFTAGEGTDSLAVTPQDLNDLVTIAPALERENMRFRFSVAPASASGNDDRTLLAVESSRPLNALNGRLAWIFQRITPVQEGWLNARLEGLPELKSRQLAFAPERGFMNDARVPKAAITKRGGMSPRDFLEPEAFPRYDSLLAVLDTVLWTGDAVVLVRRIARP